MIIQGQCDTFLLNKLKGAEDFSAISPYVYHIALYTANATLNRDTLVYTTTHEVVGTGYTAGGKLLIPIPPVVASNVAYVSFQNPTWTGADFLARGALIYNFTTLAAVAVLDFGADIHFLGTKTLTFPPATATTAVIRDTTSC
jgi:hypothetical protein